MGSLICPKPRRIRDPNFSNFPFRNQAEAFDTKAGAELIDLIHKEDGTSASPPFFLGSPPCRAMNPLIHDAHFVNEKQPRISSSPSSSSSASSSPSSSFKGRSCARARLGQSQSPNRVVGFDCRSSPMAAMA